MWSWGLLDALHIYIPLNKAADHLRDAIDRARLLHVKLSDGAGQDYRYVIVTLARRLYAVEPPWYGDETPSKIKRPLVGVTQMNPSAVFPGALVDAHRGVEAYVRWADLRRATAIYLNALRAWNHD